MEQRREQGLEGTSPLVAKPSSKSRDKGMTEDEWRYHILNSSENEYHPPLASAVSIFRVPNFLKASVPEIVSLSPYVPKRVSLGPYHHTSAELTAMDSEKGKALRRMMTRFNNRNLDKDPNNMYFCSRAVDEIVKLEKEIRESYEDKIAWDGKDIARMLSFDGAFILEILRTLGGEFKKQPQDCDFYEHIFKQEKIKHTGLDILNDILKLENQIPLIVLRKLLELELNCDDNVNEKLFKVLVKDPSHKFYPFVDKGNMSEWSWPPEQVYHLLGLLRSLIVSGLSAADQIDICIKCGSVACIIFQREKDANKKDKDKTDDFPRAVDLKNAGVKFKKCKGGIKNIKFDKRATIHLPPICITDHTEVLFRNLIAFEMCKPFETNYVACYVSLMDDLIDSKEDVALLRRMGIITNRLGSDKEVAQLFNGLCKGVTVKMDDVFDQLTLKVNAHYRSKMKVQTAEFVENNFSSLWKTSAWLGAFLVLLLSIVQTIFLIISVYK